MIFEKETGSSKQKGSNTNTRTSNVFRVPCIIDRTDLGVLVDRDCCESGFRECEGLEDAPSHAIKVVSLHHMEARLVAMHRMQNDLGENGVRP